MVINKKHIINMKIYKYLYETYSIEMVIVVGNSKRKNPYRRTLPFISLREREGWRSRRGFFASCLSKSRTGV